MLSGMNLDTTLWEMAGAGASWVAGITLGQLLVGVAAAVGVRVLLWFVTTPETPKPTPSDSIDP